MEWRGRKGSSNATYRGRSSGGVRRAGGVGGFGLVAVLLIGWYFGVDVTPLLQDQGGGRTETRTEGSAADQERAQFAAVALQYTEQVWPAVFRDQLGTEYRPVRLETFSGGLDGGACGYADPAIGPFYCPQDQTIYIDTDFFVTLSDRLGAEGDFAAAYVVAHEVAHHIQNQLGILGQVQQQRQQVSEEESNALSVQTELQADCLAGIWARNARDTLGVIEAGDFEEAVNAAGQIGDDALQQQAGRTVRPESFTHGSSQQRIDAFTTGLETVSMEACGIARG